MCGIAGIIRWGGHPADRDEVLAMTKSIAHRGPDGEAIQAGPGQYRSDAPFADIITSGMTVLLKPNWVLHHNQCWAGMACVVNLMKEKGDLWMKK